MQVRPDHPHIYHTMDSNWSQAVHEAVLIKLRTIAYNKLDYVADQLFYMCRYAICHLCIFLSPVSVQ